MKNLGKDIERIKQMMKTINEGSFDEPTESEVPLNVRQETTKIINNFIQNPDIDNESIVICLENLGWFEKEVQNNGFKDCFGNIYKEVEVFEKKWRDKIYWDVFTEQQKNVIYPLLEKICTENNIKKRFIGHNTKVKGFNKFEGVLIRSNISQRYLDLNPSFDCEYLTKKFDNDEFI